MLNVVRAGLGANYEPLTPYQNVRLDRRLIVSSQVKGSTLRW
jgi:hypothetical protein